MLLGLEDASVSVTVNWLSCRPPLGLMAGLSSVGTLSVLNVASAETPSILLTRSFDRTRKWYVVCDAPGSNGRFLNSTSCSRVADAVIGVFSL